jgi:hypothetical protein
MATPGELVHVVAKALGIPEATVVQYDRNLVAAGLRTKGGRGRSAAQVTSSDAANLFLAIGGAPIAGASVKETRKTCARYGALRAWGTRPSFSRVKSRYPTLAKLPDRHLFKEAIAALIDSIAAGEFGSPDPHLDPNVSVHFDGADPGGGIVVDYRAPRVQLMYRQPVDIQLSDTGLHQRRSFGFWTLSAVAKIVGITGMSDD